MNSITIRSLFSALLLCSMQVPAQSTNRGTMWSTYQADSSHHGYVNVQTPMLVAPTIAWQRATQALPVNGLAIGSGVVLATPLTSFGPAALVAISSSTGNELWRVTYIDKFSVNPPALDGAGATYLVTGNHAQDTHMHSYDALTGLHRWSTPLSAQWERYKAPTFADGSVATNAGDYGGLYAVNSTTGAQQFFAGLPQYDEHTPTLYGNYWVTFTDRVSMINRQTGVVEFAVPIPSYVWSGWSSGQAPVIVNDVAWITNGDRLIGVDLISHTVSFMQTMNGASGQITTDGSRLYFSVLPHDVAVTDLDGNLLHTLSIGADNLAPPYIVTRTHLIASITTGDAATAIVDLTTRQLAQRLPRGGTLALADDKLVIGEITGRVTAYSIPMIMFGDDFE